MLTIYERNAALDKNQEAFADLYNILDAIDGLEEDKAAIDDKIADLRSQMFKILEDQL